MPRLTGIEVAKEVRRIEGEENLCPMKLLLSSGSIVEDEELFDYILQKPVEAEALSRVINEL